MSFGDENPSEPEKDPQVREASESEERSRKRREELYDTHSSQARADQQASSDEFDKSLLTFSSGALGLSLAFIKDIVPLNQAGWLPWLYFSWVSFAACIAVTIASFQFGIQAQKNHLDFLYKYYIECKSEFLNKKSAWSRLVTVCAVAGALFFLAGLVGTMIFVCENVSWSMHK
jgi:hypothetical protein